MVRRGFGRFLPGAAAAALLASCSPGGPETHAPTASSAYFPVQRCINLANALNAPNEGDWGYTITEQDLQRIAGAGFDTVRVLVDWHSHALETPPFMVDPAYFARIDEVIAQSFAAGLTVIIDMHNYEDIYSDPRGHRDRAIAIWRQIAEHYADYPQGLIFELVNEPRDVLEGALWEAMAADLVRAVRESNPVRTIVLGGDNWSSLWGLQRLHLPEDPYLVATFHYYEPYDFTHQGGDWFEDPPPLGAPWGAPEERDQLREHMNTAGAWAAENRTPVFLGEFGAFHKANAVDRAAWTQAMREGAEANGMGWCYFDYAAGFDAFDREQQRWLPEIVAALDTAGSPPALRR